MYGLNAPVFVQGEGGSSSFCNQNVKKDGSTEGLDFIF